ncbi:hypothetical protein QQM79_03005 [Marinobacteraceae bacterium S3BR75-40.1]
MNSKTLLAAALTSLMLSSPVLADDVPSRRDNMHDRGGSVTHMHRMPQDMKGRDGKDENAMIQHIHEMHGDTAAGPGQGQTIRHTHTYRGVTVPEGMGAYQRKRTIFDSPQP